MAAAGNMKPGENRSKKRRSRRGKKNAVKVHLSQEDVEFLKENTKFDEQEIREWFKGFKVCQSSSPILRDFLRYWIGFSQIRFEIFWSHILR